MTLQEGHEPLDVARDGRVPVPQAAMVDGSTNLMRLSCRLMPGGRWSWDQGARVVAEAARAYVPCGVLVEGADGSQAERLAATRHVLNSVCTMDFFPARSPG